MLPDGVQMFGGVDRVDQYARLAGDPVGLLQYAGVDAAEGGGAGRAVEMRLQPGVGQGAAVEGGASVLEALVTLHERLAVTGDQGDVEPSWVGLVEAQT